MNQMQHHYGDLMSHIANQGGLLCERAVYVLLGGSPPSAEVSARQFRHLRGPF
jgi:hypothetical protein